MTTYTCTGVTHWKIPVPRTHAGAGHVTDTGVRTVAVELMPRSVSGSASGNVPYIQMTGGTREMPTAVPSNVTVDGHDTAREETREFSASKNES